MTLNDGNNKTLPFGARSLTLRHMPVWLLENLHNLDKGWIRHRLTSDQMLLLGRKP